MVQTDGHVLFFYDRGIHYIQHLSGKGLDHVWNGIGVSGLYWYTLPILILIWGGALKIYSERWGIWLLKLHFSSDNIIVLKNTFHLNAQKAKQ